MEKEKIIFLKYISIFLAIYNKEKYLERSIGCLQKQTLKEIEIIAINIFIFNIKNENV